MRKFSLVALSALAMLAAGQGASAACPETADPDAASAAFDRYDANRDGLIDSREAESNGIAAEAFAAMDSNVDRMVSKLEFLAGSPTSGEEDLPDA